MRLCCLKESPGLTRIAVAGIAVFVIGIDGVVTAEANWYCAGEVGSSAAQDGKLVLRTTLC
jgi:hypothetical protein